MNNQHQERRNEQQRNLQLEKTLTDSQLAEIVNQISSSGANNQVNIVSVSTEVANQHQCINNTNITNSKVTVNAGNEITAEVEQTNPTLCQADSFETEKQIEAKETKAISQVRKLLNAIQQEELDLLGMNIEKENIPFVHPQMVKVSFFGEVANTKKEQYVPSNDKLTKFNQGIIHDRDVKFENLLGESYRSKFVALIGYPGSGKTTLSKRLAQNDRLLCLHVKFMDINYDSETKLTLKELLLKNMFPSLCDETSTSAFNWIVKHDDQFALIMDGYDQAEWQMSRNPPKTSYNEKQCICDLVANLCKKHFLRRAFLVITSRPHSMITLPKELRPHATILLQDFTFDVMKRLLFALAGSKAEKMWQELNDKAPQLISFCQNPLMLLFVLRAYLNPSNDLDDISTITMVFASVLEDIRYSSHTHNKDIKLILSQIARIAFKRTEQHSVVITTQDLKREELSIDSVQDLLIALHGSSRPGSKVFEGDTKLFFSHQTLQEYLSALYVKNEMPLSDFKNFLYSDLFRPHWAMVRRFLCGLLINLETEKQKGFFLRSKFIFKSPSQEDVVQVKRNLLISKLIQRLKTKFTEDRNFTSHLSNNVVVDAGTLSTESCTARRGIIEFWSDVRECNCEKITMAAAKHFPTDAALHAIPLSSSDCHAVGCVLRKVDKTVNILSLSGCKLEDQGFSHICSAIKEMPGSITWLKMGKNFLSGAAVALICGILPYVERIHMQKCFKAPDCLQRRNANEEEKQKLQTALNALPPSLKTSVLVDMDNLIIISKKKI